MINDAINANDFINASASAKRFEEESRSVGWNEKCSMIEVTFPIRFQRYSRVLFSVSYIFINILEEEGKGRRRRWRKAKKRALYWL